jgi:hypothetical protein
MQYGKYHASRNSNSLPLLVNPVESAADLHMIENPDLFYCVYITFVCYVIAGEESVFTRMPTIYNLGSYQKLKI